MEWHRLRGEHRRCRATGFREMIYCRRTWSETASQRNWTWSGNGKTWVGGEELWDCLHRIKNTCGHGSKKDKSEVLLVNLTAWNGKNCENQTWRKRLKKNCTVLLDQGFWTLVPMLKDKVLFYLYQSRKRMQNRVKSMN